MTALVEIKNDDPALIVDGYVTIFLREYDLKIMQKVKQLKGRGTADADRLYDLNDYHKTMISVLFMSTWDNWTSEQIRALCRARIQSENKIFKENNWMRPVSELLRKKVLDIVPGISPPKYSLDREYAKKCLESGKFG